MAYFPTSVTLPTIPSGSLLTAGSNGSSWTTTTAYQHPTDAVMVVNQGDPPTLEVKGNMVINGRDLEERLDTIEKVLNIPERDVTLEAKHPKLKKMYDAYIKELSKYRMWETIKGDDNGTT